MNARLAEPYYQLVVPRALFTAEAAKLLNQRALNDWNERCELLLDEAFVGGYKGGPLSEFREIAVTTSDRGALFDIANNFHVRHQDAKQKRDYDDFYLDWIFWVYLASIELTNCVIDEQAAKAG